MLHQQSPCILVVDLETTDLDEGRGSIIQLGAVWLFGGPEDPDKQEFACDCRAWPGAIVDPGALEVNGASEARVWNPALPVEMEALDLFYAWIQSCLSEGRGPSVILAGLNPYFDLRWLRAAAARAGRSETIFPHRTLDLHTLALHHAVVNGKPVPTKGFKTDGIYELLSLPPEPRPHVAIQGARAEAEALRVLFGLASPYQTSAS